VPDTPATVADLLDRIREERRNTPIRDKIRADTYEHYAEHQGWIAELVRQLG